MFSAENISSIRKSVLGENKLNYAGYLPEDYVHILNCIVEFRVKKGYKCYREGDYIEFAAKRLTADMASGILHNAYMKPSYKRPYFYINNINTTTSAAIDGNNIVTGKGEEHSGLDITGS